MATRGRERLIPMKIIGDLDHDLDDLIGNEGWKDVKTGKGPRKSLIVTHEDGSTEHVLEDVSKSSWRRESCPTSPPLLISTLPNSPNPSSPVPQPKPTQFIPGHVISEPSTATKPSASGHVERGQTVHATPILIQRETAPSVETEDDDIDDSDTEAEENGEEEEEDIYSPGTVSLPNLSPISSTTSSPHRGLSPDPSYTSWTPADEETLEDMSEGKGHIEEVEWDTLEDANPPPSSLNYRVHIEVEGAEERISGVEKGKQSYNIKGQHPLSAAGSTSSERLEKPHSSCQSKPPPASRTRHPVRIVPISLHTEQVHQSPELARESETKESEVVNVEGNTNVFRRGSSLTQNKRRSESGGDAAAGTRADIPPSHHKRASSLDAAAERKVWSIPINIQPRQASAETQGAKRGGLVGSEFPTKMSSGEKIPTERCDRAAQGENEVGQHEQREKENATTHRRPSRGGDQARKISVPVRLMSEERELGSLLVHQSSEERVWGVKVPERFDADCKVSEDSMKQSQEGTSKKEERATKDDSSMFTNANNLPFGPTHKLPTNSGKPLTIDPFSHTHLPFSFPTPGLSSPPSPVRSVPIHREGKGERDNVRKDRQHNYSGPEELNKLHDGLEEARGKLTAQAKKLLDRQEKVENSLKRGKDSEDSLKGRKVSDDSNMRGKDWRQTREKERGRRGRPEARSQSSDPANRNPAEYNRPQAKRRERSLEEIDRDIATIWKELQELDSSAPPLPPRLSGAASSPSPRKSSTDRSPASRHFSFPPRVSPGTQPGSITPSYSTPSASPASTRAFPPRRAGSGSSRSRRASTPASQYGEEKCHQSENRVGLDTAAVVGDEGYAKRAGTTSSASNAPYWAEGSPMNRGSSLHQKKQEEEEEEKKVLGSNCTKLPNSTEQTGMSSNRHGRRSSSWGSEGRGGQQVEGRKSTVQSDSKHRSGPVTRIVPIHVEGEEKRHQVPIQVTDRRSRSESRGQRESSKGEVPVKVTYMDSNTNMKSKTFMGSNDNCDAFTQTFQGDKRNNCVLS